MKYYLLSSESGVLRSFKERFKLLSHSFILEKRQDLIKEFSQTETPGGVFVEYESEKERLRDLVQVVKSFSNQNLIFVIFEAKNSSEVKNLQLECPQVDAFLESSINESSLDFILSSFGGDAPPREIEEDFEGISDVKKMASHHLSLAMDETFKKYKKHLDDQLPSELSAGETGEEVNMSDKDQELSLDDLGELEIADLGTSSEGLEDNSSLELSLDADFENEEETALSLDEEINTEEDNEDNLSLEGSDELSLSGDENLDGGGDIELALGGEESSLDEDIPSLEFDQVSDPPGIEDSLSGIDESELSEEARLKLQEIDRIMDEDSSQINLSPPEANDENGENDFIPDVNNEISFEGEGFELGGMDAIQDSSNEIDIKDDELSFSNEISVENEENLLSLNAPEELEDEITPEITSPNEESRDEVPQNSEREKPQKVDTKERREISEDLNEISGAYSLELDRLKATVSNLRLDREELLKKMETLEEDKIFSNRNSLTLRAELDEKKIELVIIRKKLNEEITFLKDQIKIYQEKNHILEEKNKYLNSELEKSSQRTKLDIKKVQMREKELEQKLELLKNDTEVQVRNRDLKIIELKRKIDSMEFDMESISEQEKKTLENKVELENKLDKAIKTLRVAISTLEEENDKNEAVELLKKSFDV